MFLILNIILTSVNYHSRQPNAWYSNRWRKIMAYVMYRTGALAFYPLIFLFAGRNNFLLWLTNWSHSTFLTLHRWVSRVFALQVLLHSIVSMILYKPKAHMAKQSNHHTGSGVLLLPSALLLLHLEAHSISAISPMKRS
jgi:hypothetical protein